MNDCPLKRPFQLLKDLLDRLVGIVRERRKKILNHRRSDINNRHRTDPTLLNNLDRLDIPSVGGFLRVVVPEILVCLHPRDLRDRQGDVNVLPNLLQILQELCSLFLAFDVAAPIEGFSQLVSVFIFVPHPILITAVRQPAETAVSICCLLLVFSSRVSDFC